MPITKIDNKLDIDLTKLFSILDEEAPDVIIYEDIKSIYGVNKNTMFSLGKQIGYVKAYATIKGLTTFKVSAKTWQKKLHKDIPLVQIDGKYKQTIYKSISLLLSLIGKDRFEKDFKNKGSYHDGLIDAYMLAYFYYTLK